MKSKRTSIMVLSIAAVVVLVFLGLQMQVPTAFAFPKVQTSKVFAYPTFAVSNTASLTTNACAASGCHVNTSATGSAAVTGFPAGMTYTPGVTQHLTVTVNDTHYSNWGYLVTARLVSNLANGGGTFTATDANSAVSGLDVKAANTGVSTWNFDWTPPATASGNVNFYLSGMATSSFGSNGQYTVMYTLAPAAPAPTPDFSLSASPSSVTVTQGSSGMSTITVNPLNGFTGSVSFSASGQSSGVTASFSGNTLTLAASSTATAGTATVTVTGTSGTLTHTTTVGLTVNAAAPSSSISAAPSTLMFNYPQGSTASGSQPIMVSGNPTGLAYTAAASGASWLSIDSTSGSVPGMINAKVTAGSLMPGTYSGGKVTITSSGATGSPQVVNVTLVITPTTTGSSLTVTPSSLNFTYQLGGTAPSLQTLRIGTTRSTPLNYTASYYGSSWVSLKPTSGTTPGSISVSINLPRTGVTAGTYNGQIQISAGDATTVNVPVTLTVTSTSGGGTTGAMYAQPYVYDTTSSGTLSAQWVSHLGDSTQYNNQALELSVNASAPAGSWAGAHILNYSGLSLTEVGFDYRDGSQCTATSPRIVVSDGTTNYVVAGCSAGAIQTDVPVKGWRRVRFDLQAHPELATPQLTPGVTVKSITLVMDQGPESVPGALGGFAVIDNIDVNGTLITTGGPYIDY